MSGEPCGGQHRNLIRRRRNHCDGRACRGRGLSAQRGTDRVEICGSSRQLVWNSGYERHTSFPSVTLDDGGHVDVSGCLETLFSRPPKTQRPGCRQRGFELCFSYIFSSDFNSSYRDSLEPCNQSFEFAMIIFEAECKTYSFAEYMRSISVSGEPLTPGLLGWAQHLKFWLRYLSASRQLLPCVVSASRRKACPRTGMPCQPTARPSRR